jgi:predicted ester cyclase
LLTQVPALRFTIEAIIAEGDIVLARLLGKGVNLGPIGPLPPTGKRFASRSSHWFHVVIDDKLAEPWATRDDLSAFMQLAIVRPPGRRPA